MATNLPVLPAIGAAQATPIGEIADRLMSGTRVTIRGRLVADPELRYTGAGAAWARMRVELRGTEGTILQVVLASGRMAEASARKLRTGNRIRVDGRLRGRRWIGDDGLGRYDVDIMAGTVEFLSGVGR
jgi:single-stranded DNA-binding protein